MSQSPTNLVIHGIQALFLFSLLLFNFWLNRHVGGLENELKHKVSNEKLIGIVSEIKQDSSMDKAYIETANTYIVEAIRKGVSNG